MLTNWPSRYATRTQYLKASRIRELHANELLYSGIIESNFPRLIAIYRRRRDTMLNALTGYIGEVGKWTQPAGGPFISLTLEGIDTHELLDKALAMDVACVPGNDFYFDGRGSDSMRLNFSCMPRLKRC